MTLNAQTLLPLVIQLGQYLKAGLDHYVLLKSAGKEAGPDIVALFIDEKMKGWKPKIGDKVLLDDTTRAAGARFLAGIAVNLT